ncbi:MAG: GrpB family protein [Gemmatimonadota bacterium]|nr:GrpB family protein [Gemmatimonadota bacterium]
MTSPLGLARGSVVLVPYDPRWRALFRSERERISSVQPLTRLLLEHTGSTSVPGLCAKPIIDILAGYPTGASLEEYIDGFVRAGYTHRGEQEIPGRHFFRRGEPRSYHVHLAEAGGSFWREHLAFRDCLRREPQVREAYSALKRELASRHPREREAYIEGKGPFIREVLTRASASPGA